MKLKKKVSEIDYDLAVSLLLDHGTKYLVDTFELTDEFVGKNLTSFDWEFLTKEYVFGQDQLISWRKHITSFKDLNYKTINNLSQDFIEANKDYLDFNKLSFLNLEYDFIDKYKDRLNWDIISLNEMSEESIDKYKDYVNWTNITISQTLSEDFIDKYKDKIDFSYINLHRFSKEFSEKIDIPFRKEQSIFKSKSNRKSTYVPNDEKVYKIGSTFPSGISSDIFERYNKPSEIKYAQTYLNDVIKEEPSKLEKSILDLVINSGLENVILKELLKRKGI